MPKVQRNATSGLREEGSHRSESAANSLLSPPTMKSHKVEVAVDEMEDMPRRVGPYRLQECLGRGGMGAVFRGFDERLKRPVALKQIHAEHAVHPKARQRFRREARSAARLNHPGIVKVHDILQAAGCDWIVMELVEGETLAELLGSNTFDLVGTLSLAAEIAEALAAAHAEGIVHRDLKAENVLVTSTDDGSPGHAKILDFGLAKQVLHRDGQSASISVEGQVLGTPRAMSPEQAMGHRVDLRSDLFSFGSLVYQMIVGSPPFKGSSPMETLRKLCAYHPPPVHQQLPDTPQELSELIEMLLEKDPSHRPSTAAEVASALHRIKDGVSRGNLQQAVLPQGDDSETSTRAVPGRTRLTSERRQVTVMCCELVSRSESSHSLDPEQLYGVIAPFEAFARQVVEELRGHVNNVMGHRLVVYFGFPLAKEDDSRRAVRAALTILEGFKNLQEDSQASQKLAVRTGIHTGAAVALGIATPKEQLVLGKTLDCASGLMRQAAAGQVLISSTVQRLISGTYSTQLQHEIQVPGLSENSGVYDVLGAGESSSPWQVQDGVTPFVARTLELEMLGERYRLACGGTGQLVLLSGEAGIGKSRLIHAFYQQLEGFAPRWMHAQCSSFTINTPLGALVEMLRGLFGLNNEDPSAQQFAQLEKALSAYDLAQAEAVPLFAQLFALPLSDRYAQLAYSPQKQRLRTLETIVQVLLASAEEHPAILVVEDLHWADPSTCELLSLLVGKIVEGKLFALLSFREQFEPPWTPSANLTAINLNRFQSRDVEALIKLVTKGKKLPDEVRATIHGKTDGIPLFVEELTRNLLESQQLIEHEDHWELAEPLRPLMIPDTLRDALAERLDRQGEAKEVAQLASVIGREFSFQVLDAISSFTKAELNHQLALLTKARLIQRKGFSSRVRYLFRHALIQDAAYDSLVKTQRRELHQTIATTLETLFPEIEEREPELLAHHYTEAGLPKPAIGYWQCAADVALDRSANYESIEHTRKGLGLIEELPEGDERNVQELGLQMTQSGAWTPLKGWGAEETGSALNRAQELTKQLGETPTLFPVLYGFWGYHATGARYREARETAKQLVKIAKSTDNREHLIDSYYCLGGIEFFAGDALSGRKHLERAIILDTPDRGRSDAARYNDSGVSALSWLAILLWHQGNYDQAIERSEEAITLANKISHAYTQCWALAFAVWLYTLCYDIQKAKAKSQELMSLSEEKGIFFFLPPTKVCLGWMDTFCGDKTSERQMSLELMREGLLSYLGSGNKFGATFFYSRLIESCIWLDHLDEAEQYLEQALVHITESGEHFLEAEILRLAGEIQLRKIETGFQSQEEPENFFESALKLAGSQGAKVLELRASMSLSRRWCQRGRTEDARSLLSAKYSQFSEGFESVDLKEARGLLKILS